MKVLLLLLFFCNCGTSQNGESMPVTDTIRVKAHERFTIQLPTSMGTGYSWTITDSAYTTNMSLDSVSVINNAQKEDGQDQQVFYFHALVKSNTKIPFIRKRSWEPDSKADKEKTFTVIIE